MEITNGRAVFSSLEEYYDTAKIKSKATRITKRFLYIIKPQPIAAGMEKPFKVKVIMVENIACFFIYLKTASTVPSTSVDKIRS